MPQFNLLYFPSQIFWLAISFVLLYVALAFVLLPRIEKVLQKRDDKMQRILTQADQMNAKAKEMEAQYESYIEKAAQQADAILDAAHLSFQQKDFEQEAFQAHQTQISLDKVQKDAEQKENLISKQIDNICEVFIQTLFRIVYKKKVALGRLKKSIQKAMKELKDVGESS